MDGFKQRTRLWYGHTVSRWEGGLFPEYKRISDLATGVMGKNCSTGWSINAFIHVVSTFSYRLKGPACLRMDAHVGTAGE